MVYTKVARGRKLSITVGTGVQSKAPMGPQVGSQGIGGDKPFVAQVTPEGPIPRMGPHVGLKKARKRRMQTGLIYKK